MGRMRKLGVAMVLAVAMAVAMGSTAQAAGKKPGGGGEKAICAYLEAIINYEYVTPSILKWALALWDHYSCGD